MSATKKIWAVIVVFILTATLLFQPRLSANDTLYWTTREETPVFLTSATGQPEWFRIKKGERVEIMSRDGNFEYQVNLSAKGRGWARYHHFNEGRLLVIISEADIYKKDDFNKGTIGKTIVGDAVRYLEENTDKGMIRISKDGEYSGWVFRSCVWPADREKIPLRIDDNRIYRDDRLISFAAQKNQEELVESFGNPTAIKISGNNSLWFYQDFTVVSDKKHYDGVFFRLADGVFSGDSLAGEGRNVWTESMPLAHFFRGIPFTHRFSSRNISIEPYFDKLSEKGRWGKWLTFIFKLLLVLIIFGFPAIIGQLAFRSLAYVRAIPNNTLKFLNYPVYYLVFYLVAMFILFSTVSDDPVFFGALCLVLLLLISKAYPIKRFNHLTINYKRCSKCHHLSGSVKDVELVDKTHSFVSYTWDKYLGSKTTYSQVDSVNVRTKTDYYQKQTSTSPVTYMKYRDICACNQCNNSWFITRVETISGHC